MSENASEIIEAEVTAATDPNGSEEAAVAVEAASESVSAPTTADDTPAAAAEASTTADDTPSAAAEAPTTAEASSPPTAASTEPASAESDAPAQPDKRRGRPRTRLEDVTVGTEIHGRVVGLAKFGAFVDIGAMTDGLVHISEFSKRGVRRVEDVLKSGDAVDVWVKDVDVAGNKISLTMRQPALHPMSGLKEGDVLTGTVTTVAVYGAFVDIGSDTEGLVHVSEMSSGFVQRPEDVVKNGETVEVRIKEIDRSKPRISLSMKGLANDTGIGMEQESDRTSGGRNDDYQVEEVVEERGPTVVELALRRAMGEAGAEDSAGKSGKSGGKSSKNSSLGDVYSRMIEEYRATKAAENATKTAEK
jgi:predicted RNA-binding protein with RPS1 domain